MQSDQVTRINYQMVFMHVARVTIWFFNMVHSKSNLEKEK